MGLAFTEGFDYDNGTISLPSAAPLAFKWVLVESPWVADTFGRLAGLGRDSGNVCARASTTGGKLLKVFPDYFNVATLALFFAVELSAPPATASPLLQTACHH